MLKRVLTAVVAIPVFLGAMWYSPQAFGWLMTALSVLAVFELTKAVRSTGRQICFPIAMMGPVVVAASTMNSYKRTEWIVAAACMVVLTVYGVLQEGLRKRTEENGLGIVIARGFGAAVWIGMFAAPVFIRNWMLTRTVSHYSGPDGLGAILLATLCVWAADSFALFGGMVFGQRKLAPNISPNKTWEGAFSGLLAALLVGWLALRLYPVSHTSLTGDALLALPVGISRDEETLVGVHGIPIGLIAGIVGPIGDLFESWVKRRLGVKDMGGILPGHGGVLDRFDSYLFVCTAVLFYLEVSNLWPR